MTAYSSADAVKPDLNGLFLEDVGFPLEPQKGFHVDPHQQEMRIMDRLTHIFTRFAVVVSEWTGKPAIFVLALCSVVVWGVTGPVFNYSDTWQLVINTSTTIVTFLMVFLLQNAQTRDTRAIQAKLNELILTSAAENRFVGIENLDDEDLKHLDRLVEKAAKRHHEKHEGGAGESVEHNQAVAAKSANKAKRRRVSRTASTKEQSKTGRSSRKPA